MAVNQKVVVGGAAAALIGLFAWANASEAPAAKKTPEPKRQPTEKERAIALAVRYARLYGVPPSLVLALLAVGGWRVRGHVANSRGGAWGYSFMTVATAADLTKRHPALARQDWPRFNGTGESLYDPATAIALGAYQLSLQWKRYRDWLTAALSYYSGAGRMDGIRKAAGGKLPPVSKLPADVASMAAAYTRVRTADPYVKKALVSEAAGKTAGVGGAIPSKQATVANQLKLAAKLDTVDKCRLALGAAAVTLNKAYPIADNTPFIASWAGLKKGLHQRIDSVNTYAQRVYQEVSALKTPPDLTIRKKVALAVLQATDVLTDTDAAVNDPDLALMPNFTAALKQILEAAAAAVAAAMPDWAPWAAGGIAVVAGAVLLTRK